MGSVSVFLSLSVGMGCFCLVVLFNPAEVGIGLKYGGCYFSVGTPMYASKYFSVGVVHKC